jgi:acetyl esterase
MAASDRKKQERIMKRMFVRSMLLVMVIAAIAGGQPVLAVPAQSSICPQTLPPRPLSIEGSTAHVYKSIQGVDLRLHVFAPARRQSDKLPALVYFYGGGWMAGNVTVAVPEAKYLAGRGMVAILVDYRGYCRDKAGVTDEMADAKSAIRWVRSHAKELGIDPKRIAASGRSSGGHLALSTAAFNSFDDPTENKKISSKPNLLVLFYPCVDPTTEEERQYSALALGNHGVDISPAHHMTGGLPPMIVFQGTADSLYAGVNKYCTEVGKLGNSCEFFRYEGAPHGFFNPEANEGKWYRDVLSGVDDFLTKRGYLK